MISAIYDRRSIRKFIDKPVSQKDITDIIQSGIKAPSSKNRQPWKYIVIQGNAREEMLNVFRQGIEREENGSLWICDIYFAYSELCRWLGSDGQLIAAVAFGYPNESPEERPRRKIDDIVEWRN